MTWHQQVHALTWGMDIIFQRLLGPEMRMDVAWVFFLGVFFIYSKSWSCSGLSVSAAQLGAVAAL